jgi:hypothetical protein
MIPTKRVATSVPRIPAVAAGLRARHKAIRHNERPPKEDTIVPPISRRANHSDPIYTITRHYASESSQ